MAVYFAILLFSSPCKGTCLFRTGFFLQWIGENKTKAKNERFCVEVLCWFYISLRTVFCFVFSVHLNDQHGMWSRRPVPNVKVATTLASHHAWLCSVHLSYEESSKLLLINLSFFLKKKTRKKEDKAIIFVCKKKEDKSHNFCL